VDRVTDVVDGIEPPVALFATSVIVYEVFVERPVTVKGDVVFVPPPLLGL
jgi:hypothetical protein